MKPTILTAVSHATYFLHSHSADILHNPFDIAQIYSHSCYIMHAFSYKFSLWKCRNIISLICTNFITIQPLAHGHHNLLMFTQTRDAHVQRAKNCM